MNKSNEFWDKSAAGYDKTEERFDFIHSKSRENAKKYLKNTDVVLDYGCGTGTTSCVISNHVNKVHAIDISSKMIEIATEKAAASKAENVHFVRTDIFDKRFEEESFDAILAFNMLHTVPDPHGVMRRIFELLTRDGIFISITPCLRERMSFLVRAQILLVRLLCKIGIIPIPIRRLQRSDLHDLIVDGRFQILDTEMIYKGASSYFMAAKKIYKPTAIAG